MLVDFPIATTKHDKHLVAQSQAQKCSKRNRNGDKATRARVSGQTVSKGAHAAVCRRGRRDFAALRLGASSVEYNHGLLYRTLLLPSIQLTNKMANSNIHAFTYTVQTLLKQPAQFLPHLTIPTFAQLPEQLGQHLPPAPAPAPSTTSTGDEKRQEAKKTTIRALVLDKDNTLCAPQTTIFPPAILTKLHALRTSPTSPFNQSTSPSSILIVSNRAGSHPRYEHEVRALERALADAGLRVPVYILPEGQRKKPFCGEGVVAWFRERGVVSGADEIAVVGDRLGTDGVMARRMGAWSVWCRDGVVEGRPGGGVLERMERWVERYLRVSRGLRAPRPGC